MPQRRAHMLIHRPWVVRLALLVAVLVALAPTLSHALAQAGWMGGAQQGSFICSTNGPRWVAAQPGASSEQTSPTGGDVAHVFNHCPFCLHNADRIAPPPGLVAHPNLTSGGFMGCTVWQAFLFEFTRYTAATPRGPPGKNTA
ncbi:MAG: hypothetical protein RIR09_2234 [Pseudomonadota bacterium]